MIVYLLATGLQCTAVDDSKGCGERALHAAMCLLIDAELSVDQTESALVRISRQDGHSIADLASASEALGAFPLLLRLPPDRLSELPAGAIVHLETSTGHFSIFLGTEGDAVYLADAPFAIRKVRMADFLDEWQGVALVLFRESEERERYAADLSPGASHFLNWALLITTLVVVLVGSCGFRRGWLAAALILCAPSCADVHPEQEPRADQFVEMSFDAGYVPPSGAELSLKVRNPKGHALHVDRIEKSCSCADISLPDTLPANGDVRAIVSIRGGTLPSRRQVNATIHATDGTSIPVRVIYDTGDVPCVLPPSVSMDFEPETRGVSGDAVLWLVDVGDLVTLASSHFSVHAIPGHGYEVSAGSEGVVLRRRGLTSVRIVLEVPDDARLSGRGELDVFHAEREVVLSVAYRVLVNKGVVLRPAVTRVVVEDHGVTERVFIASGPRAFSPRIVSCPEYCQCEWHALSPSSWKLLVRIDAALVPIDCDEFDLDVASSEVESTEAHTATCRIIVQRVSPP